MEKSYTYLENWHYSLKIWKSRENWQISVMFTVVWMWKNQNVKLSKFNVKQLFIGVGIMEKREPTPLKLMLKYDLIISVKQSKIKLRHSININPAIQRHWKLRVKSIDFKMFKHDLKISTCPAPHPPSPSQLLASSDSLLLIGYYLYPVNLHTH